MNQPTVAFVDIDGTLVRKSLERWFVDFLIRKHHIRRRDVLKSLFILWLRMPPTHWYRFKLAYLRGCPRDQVRKWMEQCWQVVVKDQLYVGTCEAVRWLQSVGVRIVIQSGTPRPLAQPLLELLQISDALCAEPEVNDGFYTGGLTRPHPRGRMKFSVADEWLRNNGYGWDQVAVVADHWHDRFVLSRSAVAVVVKPRSRLRRLAIQQDWVILDRPDDPNSVMDKLKKIPFSTKSS